MNVPEKVQALQAALSRAAKRSPRRRFGALYDKLYRADVLMAAWKAVRANKGGPGIDEESIAYIETVIGVEAFLAGIGRELRAQRYRPKAVKRCWIPKPGKPEKRPLGIPVIRDRVVQAACKLVIEPIFETNFLACSNGFRPRRSAPMAIRQIQRAMTYAQQTQVIDADISGFFDNVRQSTLLQLVARRISDPRVLKLIRGWLRAGVMEDGKYQASAGRGTPQGGVISPLLANIYLHPLDEKMSKLGYLMVRYADDFVILCQSAEQAHAALGEVKAWVEENGLSLHPDKTHIGDCRIVGQGFEFLGYRFEAGKRWVRKKSLQGFKAKIREKTRRTRGDSLSKIIADITPTIRGWYGYFKHAYRSTFPRLDGFIRRRLRAILRKQEKRPGMGLCRADHTRWPNAYFAKLGLFTMTQARI